MKVGLLGALEVSGPGGGARFTGAKERLVLALLALRPGEVVSRDALVDGLWGERPPETAVKTLQGHVARVRRALEGAGLADVLVTRDPGYVLHVPAESIDVTGFERRAAAGRTALAAGDAPTATIELGAALALWRGDALSDCRGAGWVEAQALRLDELRLSTVEDRIDADLLLGRHGVLAAELESLVARHPLRERLWGALMVALYRSGRQADAVRAYQRARDVLVSEMGLEPGAELRRLEAAVLAGDPGLDAPDPTDHPAPGASRIALPERLAAASAAVFVGRGPEREVLRQALAAAVSGERRVVVLSGEPGIGKTSLAAAVAREAFAEGAVVLYGRCDHDLGVAYQPWVEVFAHLATHAPPDVAELVPDLAHRVPTERVASTDAASDRYLLFRSVIDLLTRISTRAPVVLVLDDLHWADRPTIQLLQHVVAADGPRRLLVVGAFRDSDVEVEDPLADGLADLHREPGVERLTLGGLDDDDLLRLVEAEGGSATADEQATLRDTLSAETDGNPFFVGELLRHRSEIVGVPVSVREVVGQRVARLGEPTRRALSVAAVIGREFDAAVVGLVTGDDLDTVIELCDGAVSGALLTEADDAGRYAFAHALVEHALYGGHSAARRGRTHRLVAEAIEELAGDDPGAQIGELAHHWAQAQPPDPAKAAGAAQHAGDRALAQLAPEEARRWYEQALDHLDRSAGDDPRCRAALLLGLGDAQRQCGDPAHRETLLAAGHLADDAGAVDLLVRAALRNNRGWNSTVGAVDKERVELLELALSRRGGSDSPDRARLLALLSSELLFGAEFDDRLAMATTAVDMARRIGDDAALVDAIRLSHEAISMPESLALRHGWNAEACALVEVLGDPAARLSANEARYVAAVAVGDADTMREASVIFRAEAERIGQPLTRWQLAYHAARQRSLAGDIDGAEQAATEALALGTAAGHPEDALSFYGAQSLPLTWMRGQLHDMIPLVEAFAEDNPGMGIFRAALTQAKSIEGDPDEVRRMLDAELIAGFPINADATWLVAQLLWADAAANVAHRPAADALYERVLPWHDQVATAHLMVQGAVAHYLGRLAHTLVRHDEADRWFRQALALHESLDAAFFVALTRAAWAGLLADRGAPGDASQAQDLAEAALAAATAGGYGYVAHDARAVLERLA